MVTFNYKVHGSCNIGELFVIVLAQTGDMVLREPFRSALQQRLTALQQHISNTDMMCNTEKLCAWYVYRVTELNIWISVFSTVHNGRLLFTTCKFL